MPCVLTRSIAPGTTSSHAGHGDTELAKNVTSVVSKSFIEQNSAHAAGALLALLYTGVPESPVRQAAPNERAHVVQLVLANATQSYLESLTADVRGREIVATWLEDAIPPRKADVADKSGLYKDVLVPLLVLLDRMPIQLGHLKDHTGLGKLITGVQKRVTDPNARRIADSIKEKWSALISGTAKVDPARQKRQAMPEAPDSVKRARAMPRERVGSPLGGTPGAVPTTRGISPQPSSTAASMQRPAAASTAARVRTARNNPNADLAGFMSLIEQPISTTPEPERRETAVKAPTERKKRKKTVHWKDHDGQDLVAVRLIQPAVYDGDEDSHTSAGLLDMEEGGAFRQAHAEMSEQIDWYPPTGACCFVLTPEIILPEVVQTLPPHGSRSTTKADQEEREQTTAMAIYLNPSEIPESPAEPDPSALNLMARAPEPQAMTMGIDVSPFIFTDTRRRERPSRRHTSPPPMNPAPPNLPAMAAFMEQLGSAASTGGPPPAGMPGFPDMGMLQSIMQTAQNAGIVPPGGNPPLPPFPGDAGPQNDARRGRRASKHFRSQGGYVPI